MAESLPDADLIRATDRAIGPTSSRDESADGFGGVSVDSVGCPVDAVCAAATLGNVVRFVPPPVG
ncbi:hypothetical protein [Humibacter soli]